MSRAESEISAAEAAVEAWVSCKPQGSVLEEARLPELLPLIALKVPSTSPELYNRMLEELFVGRGGNAPIFLTLLQPQAGKVHFLSFWKAFSKAVRMADDTPEEILLSELETLRDRVLHALSKGSRREFSVSSRERFISQQATISLSALREEVQRAASMSAQPGFWHEAVALVSEHLKIPELNVEAVSSLLLLWLNACIRWEHMMDMPPSTPELLGQGQCFNPFKEAWDMAASFGSSAILPSSTKQASFTQRPAPRPGLMVYLHVYDVSQTEGIQRLNGVLAHASSPLKFGGVFHAGVEVNGLEWAFAYQPHETRYGVHCNVPKTHPQHHFRQTVRMGTTECSEEQITKIVAKMVEDYPGNDYDLLRRNCCHFADDLCQRLCVGRIPLWVHRLARIGAGVATMLETAQSARNKVAAKLHSSKAEPTHDIFRTMTEAEFDME